MSTSNFLNLFVTFIVKLYILLYTKYTMYREYSANKVLNGYGKEYQMILFLFQKSLLHLLFHINETKNENEFSFC